ncbi:hypothetical protein [Aquamicrobium soli]|uniref:Uncharacterized protein n=1 Tax=Aquamicrobium soli TaxID=1811518 RepID=A0ABV7K462_9HYPH
MTDGHFSAFNRALAEDHSYTNNSMPKRSLPATGEAISTGPDAKLLRLEAEFFAARDLEERTAEKVEKIEIEIDKLTSRLHRAEKRLERRTVRAGRLMEKIMSTRARTLAGMLAKVRVRKRWAGDDEESEKAALESLVKDLERMAGPAATD